MSFRRLFLVRAAASVGALLLLAQSSSLRAQRGPQKGEWRDYAGDPSGMK